MTFKYAGTGHENKLLSCQETDTAQGSDGGQKRLASQAKHGNEHTGMSRGNAQLGWAADQPGI